jgi:L-threonylcarbamoyladenylate synthase
MPQVSIDNLVAAACAGKLVSFPTDTVPALATLPEHAGLIFTAKQRNQDKPLILMAASAEEFWDFVVGSDAELEIWRQVAAKYLPGALTMVLPASPKVPSSMNPTDPTTIGMRVPASVIAQSILSRTGPMATTSANLSGQPALLTMAEIEAQFPDVLALAATECENLALVGIPSTVAKWINGQWQILRQGRVKLQF